MTERKGSAFAGLGVAIITPFRDGHLDKDRLREQIEFQISAGNNFFGSGWDDRAESPTLSHEEHECVISEVIQLAAGRCKVMAGTGSNSTAECFRPTRWAAREGADASLQSP